MERDDDLGRRFAELKRWDRRRTPSFDALMRTPRPTGVRWVPIAAAATLLGIALGVGALLKARPGERIRWLVDWQSPTAALLTVPGPDFASTAPLLSTSIIHTEAE